MYFKKITFKELMLIMLIILCAYPKGIGLFSIIDFQKVNREFGSAVVISSITPIILLYILIFIVRRKIKIDDIKEPVFIFMLFVIVSFFFPIDRDIRLSLFALILIIQYAILLIILGNIYTYREISKCINISFKISLIIQTILGGLKTFFEIKIPYITDSGVDVIRNGVIRMTGTFSHSGEFSMYIAIIFIYFLCQYYFMKKKGNIIYILICIFDLFYSGARSILIISTMCFILIVMIKYRKSIILKFSYAILLFSSITIFINSNVFYKLFIEKNFLEMFEVRFLHVIVGIRILTRNIINFLFGVGINNNVDYIINNYDFCFGDLSLNSLVSVQFMQSNPIHNSFLVVATELGIVGLLLYIWIFARELKNFRLIKSLEDNKKSDFVFVMVSLLALIIYGLQGWALLKQPLWIMLIVIISLSNIIRKSGGVNEGN
nr:O-antigen ligase family protein [Clostridium paraputrificum]